MFAGSFRGITQTMPLAIYDQFATDFPAALALSAVLVVIGAALLIAVKVAFGGAGQQLTAAPGQER
jgi:molybdate transport system permease protein